MALGTAFGGSGPAGPSRAENAGGNIWSSTPWNADGWVVTTGHAKAEVTSAIGAKSANPSGSAPLTVPDPVATAMGGIQMPSNDMLLIGAGLLLVVILIKKAKK